MARMAEQPQPVIVQGLGPIGLKILAAALGEADFQVVGAVDIDEAKIGRPLSDFLPGAPALDVQPALDFLHTANTIVLQATGSYLLKTAPHIESALSHGLHVVSTCEELAWPFERHPLIARRIDDQAAAAGCTVVGTGVNPGFLMDQLPITLRGASHGIRALRVRRVQDPRVRRKQFQDKVGLGLSRAAYDDKLKSGAFGHVGLRESGHLLAAGLDWQVIAWRESIDPVLEGPEGPVLGSIQRLEGCTGDGRNIELHFEVSTRVGLGYDQIEVLGTPPLRLRFEGGVQGDDATAAAVLRAARVIPACRRGLITVLDLPLRA